MDFIKRVILYLYFLIYKIKNLGRLKLRGFTILYAFPGSHITIGKHTEIVSDFIGNLLGMYQRSIIIARHGGVVEIGEHCAISGSTIYAIKRIVLGDYTFIGVNCKIIDNDFHPLKDSERRINPVGNVKAKDVIIGDGCFIGANSIILKGTQMGNNCVVGAGSVVSGIFPSNCIIAGNPAKIIKMQDE